MRGLRDQNTRIEESTVQESDFKLPLTLDAVRKEMNRSYYDPSLMESVLRVLEDTGVISSHNTKKHLAWRSLKIDMLASLTSPNSTKDHILCYVLWMALVYTIDDIRDRFIIDDEDSIGNHAMVQRYIEIVRDTNDDILGLVDGDTEDLPPLKHFKPNHGVVKLARYLRAKSLACLDRRAYDEYVYQLDDHLRKGVTFCTPHIFAMKAGKPFPLSIEEFEELRMKDSAGALCVFFAGGTSYGQCEDRKVLDKCLDLVTLHAALLNDIFSYEKQIYREKDRFNYVCAVQELRQVPFDEAAHLTVERANECLSDHTRLSKLVDPDDQAAQHILDTQRRWFSGHIAWVKECGRYSSQTSPFMFLRTVKSTMDSSLCPED
ncbi:uncharacterized protein LOC134811000 isoform X2 [Bolinopsis microptera]|uniref:uncharacterized protein LOC134811000 isoform X2 n=1 Tax=Bolinopsis microptera TaxID=2820187 RepID=UPI003079A14B